LAIIAAVVVVVVAEDEVEVDVNIHGKKYSIWFRQLLGQCLFLIK
jgi:hypothetical protein